ncbi:MAG TPA: carboxypeptidase regulatory-like domain-containing protein, partial [Terriglobales bacterium]|nr:carboxypeptidase regulatory-like domain-containing protein [Terriglobales bacterium]
TLRFDDSVKRYGFLVACLVLVLMISGITFAQTTISTGSIQGTVTDPSGAVVPGAKVSIRNRGTNQVIETGTTSSGTFASGALIPGQYVVRIEAKGFQTVELPITVEVNTTSAANAKMTVGQSAQVIEVEGSALSVNTEQATVQGVLTSQQIENLPINGRNFLDLAQLEPGVQIQDGGTFDPTKNGFSSVSFGGRFGRTARIEVDGIDISDETVGTTTQNLPLGAIQESALQQSSLDLSTELTSSGSVNVITKSGTNAVHGEGFYYFRDQVMDAALPGGSTNPFQRNQFGGSLGGPIIKDKLFFFLDAERTKQDLLDPVIPSGDFGNLTGNFTSPFRETETIGRLDWQVKRYKIFYRFNYDQNKSVLPFIPNSFQPFANVDHARGHLIGADFNTGTWTHSIRFGYTKFENGIKDAVTGSSIFDPAPGLELAIGGDPFCLTAGANDFCSGPNFLAPQATMQSNKQIKYDGSKPFRNHIFRFGVGFNHIQGGGFAKFLGTAPAVGSPSLVAGTHLACVTAGNCPFPGGDNQPLNYPVDNVTLGNGQGFSSELPAFGLPGGGLGPDNRFSWYLGDSWKVRPNFTVTAGLRYVRDTGRTDSDIGHIAALDQFNNQFYSGLGNPVRQPNHNFAPQLGIAWDPRSNGKTVIRAGVGLFYENSIWNNNLFDRPARLQKGLFLGFAGACSGGQPTAVTLPNGGSVTPSFCGQPIGSVVDQIVALQQQYQASTLAAGPAVNGVFIGNTLTDDVFTSTNLFGPNYRTPRSVQMNLGVQREIRSGTVVAVDYLRNVATHTMLIVDTNHVGDARFFDKAAAQAAIATTLTKCGVGTIAQSYSGNCPLDPATGTNDGGTWNTPGNPARPANIADYAGYGLDSGYSVCGGFPCPGVAAFPGINSAIGANQMLFPIGRSVYNGLQATLKQNANNPLPGIRHVNMQVSYSFSRYVSTARDGDFINFPIDYANPTRYIGPNGLDRTHQLSFGGYLEFPKGFRLGFTSHFDSPLPTSVTLPVTGGLGGIFQVDLTGDGTDGSGASNRGAGDLLPGTNVGGFGREFGVNGLNKLITSFNNTMVGQATPAGQVLIANGLMSLTDLQGLGGVIGGSTPTATAAFGPLQLAPPGAVGQGWLKTFDMNLSWGYRFKDRFEIRPGVAFFNLFNFANFDGPAVPFSSILDGSQGSPNGTTSPQPAALRLGLGSGVNALGAPRAIEWSLRFTF